jgi:hypothetical protein
MKKKVKAAKDQQETVGKTSNLKVTVGEDEFCPTCMEWRAYDEITGKCKVCGRIIKRIGDARKITDEYDLKDFGNDHDELQETEEF